MTRDPRRRVVVLLKTAQGGLWVLPQVEELRRRDHEVVLVLPPGGGRLVEELTARGFDVRRSPFDFRFRPSPSTLRDLLRLRQLLRALRPDVVQYHLYASALAARLATLGTGIRRVHMVAGPLFLESGLIRRAERWLHRLDDLVVCGTADTSRRYGELGCPPSRRPVATYGVDTGRFAPPTDPRRHDEIRAKVRSELGIAQDAFVVVMVAYVYPPRRLVHRGLGIKGHDVLLDAWREFAARHPRAHLLLIGAGWGTRGEAHRRELVERFRLAEDPTVTWLTDVADVRDHYLAADVSVSPSLSEGHGAALEAGAMAVPCIVSDAGGLPETVDGSTGWVVPRGDAAALGAALRSAYREEATGQLRARGRRSRARMSARFDNRASAVTVADLIESVVAR
ncbi:glycosyltransferase [Micromonospora coxensis]|uniref:glycosyltransferase n=1 Tax=Micromonospora coxensis TaxID=356852 RepID=UPI003424D88A